MFQLYITMKLTESEDGADMDQDEQLSCEIVQFKTNLDDFFGTNGCKLYKFSTLGHAQHTTQVLLYRMVQDLNTGTTL